MGEKGATTADDEEGDSFARTHATILQEPLTLYNPATEELDGGGN